MIYADAKLEAIALNKQTKQPYAVVQSEGSFASSFTTATAMDAKLRNLQLFFVADKYKQHTRTEGGKK